LTCDNLSVIINQGDVIQMSHKTHGQLVAEEMNADSSFREEWESTALARLVATRLIDYRTEHGLSQRKLASLLEWKQPFIAKLESGERNPEFETLVRISRVLQIEFLLDIAPATRTPKLITKRVREQHATAQRDGVSVTLAAA